MSYGSLVFRSAAALQIPVHLAKEVFRAEVHQGKGALIHDPQPVPAGQSAVLFRVFPDFGDSVRIPVHETGINPVQLAVYGLLLPGGIACLLPEDRARQAAEETAVAVNLIFIEKIVQTSLPNISFLFRTVSRSRFISLFVARILDFRNEVPLMSTAYGAKTDGSSK